MDLVISGIALSYQWCPSLKRLEENLVGKRAPGPSLVEHAGEIIHQAVQHAKLDQGSHLAILLDTGKIELGHYLPLIQREYDCVDLIDPLSQNLGDQIDQAMSLINDKDNIHVVLCDTSSSGTAALVLSPSNHTGKRIVKLIPGSNPLAIPSKADYVEISGAAMNSADKIVEDLQMAISSREFNYPVAVGHFKTPGSRSVEILNLIQAILSVKIKYIPPSDLLHTSIPPGLKEEPFYLNQEYRPWLSRGENFIRSAIFICSDNNESARTFLLEEDNPIPGKLNIRVASGTDPYLLLINGDDEAEIIANLDKLDTRLNSSGSLLKLTEWAYTQFSGSYKSFICCLVGKDREELSKELEHARNGIQNSFATGKIWNSPNGSYFTAQPLGDQGIAFVYPGAFNSYPGMGRDLFFSFPGIHEAIQARIPNPSHSMAEKFIYIQNSKRESNSPVDSAASDFFQHPNQLFESGISLSVLYTLILDQVFGLKPDAALGYSLGEVSMLWANQVWKNAGEISNTWKESTLFKDQLAGKMQVVRDHWSDYELSTNFWDSYILKTNAQKAQAACDKEPLVYLTIQNTATEVVIAGERKACQRVIQDLDCHSLPMPLKTAIHNPAIESTYQAFVDLYTNKTLPRSDIHFYTAADYQQLTLDESMLADAMARMTCNPVDFPRLVNKVYESGPKIFIEVGPQKTCSRWIEKILKDKPYAAVSINKKYQSDYHGVLKVISLLLSHGVNLDLGVLFPGLSERTKPPASAWIDQKQDDPEPYAPVENWNTPTGEDEVTSISEDYIQHLTRVSNDMAKSHQDYLRQHQTMTRNLARILELQAGSTPNDPSSLPGTEFKFTRSQIEAFTNGDHRECFGNTFSGFGDRRIPRLPNGDLQFIDRVLSIDGEQGSLQEGTSLVSEFDVPKRSWYRNGNINSLAPVSVMEIALQPCGFLSAYLGSIAGRESQDLYFRNLDGEGTILSWPGSPNGVIRNHVKLLSSSTLEDVIIQNYSFELTWGNELFYRGNSSFGYFPQAMLENQVGLDGDQFASTWFEDNSHTGSWLEVSSKKPSSRSKWSSHLQEIDRIWISKSGGKHSLGYIYLEQEIPSDAWFYQAHFYQDPVMPGSLGVDIMNRALAEAARYFGLPEGLNWRMKSGANTKWKYRGQITPKTQKITLDLHVTHIESRGNDSVIIAEANLWNADKRIYQVENLSLESY